MKVGVVGEIHTCGYEIFENNNIEYFVTNSKEEDQLTNELSDVDGIVVIGGLFCFEIYFNC